MSKELELTIAAKIDKYTNNGCIIIRNEDAPYVLFCAKDIGKVVGIKNIHDNSLLCNDNLFAKSMTPGGIQQLIYITYTGLLKILTKSRKICVYEFANAIGLDITPLDI